MITAPFSAGAWFVQGVAAAVVTIVTLPYGALVGVLLYLDLRTRKEVVYTILGQADAVPEKNVISYQSPLGRGLIGKVLDDEVAIAIPAGPAVSHRELHALGIEPP